MVKRSKFFAYLALTAAPILWGGALVAGRIVSSAIPPFTAACVRFIVTSLLLYPVVYRMEGGIPRMPKKSRLPLFLAGLSGVALFNYFLFAGLQTVSAGRSSVIIASTPAVIALVSIITKEERHSPLFLIAIALAFFGAATVIADGNPASLLSTPPGKGDLLILACVASWTLYSFAGKKALEHVSSLTAVFFASLIGAVLLAVPAFLENSFHALLHADPVVLINLLYMSIGAAGLAHLSYYYGIQNIGPSRSAIFMNLEPVSAIILGVLLLGEILTVSLGIGTVLVLSGVSLSIIFSHR